MTRIFVYGSLKRGFPLHGALLGQQFLGASRTAPGFRLYDVGAFPAMTVDPDPDGCRMIDGEVYEVDDECLDDLDRIEGEGRLYERVEIELEVGKAQAYLFLHDTSKLDDAGDCWELGR